MIRHQRLVAMLMRVSLSPLCWRCLFSLTHPPHSSSYSRSPYLSLSIIHYPILSLSSGHSEKMMEGWRTDRWCCMQHLLPKVQFLSGIFLANPQGRLCLMNSLPLPREDDLLLNPHPSHEHINTGDHKCQSDHTCHGDWTHMHSNNLLYLRHLQWLRIRHVEGQNRRPVLDLQVNGCWSQGYREWWERWRVKARSISAPRGEMGRDAARTHWPLLDSGHYYGVNWGIYMTDWQTLPPGVQANGCNYFLHLQIWLLSNHWGQKKAKIKDLDCTTSSTFQPCSGERVCVSLFSWLAVSLLSGNIMRL